jgi:hypothetical protein
MKLLPLLSCAAALGAASLGMAVESRLDEAVSRIDNLAHAFRKCVRIGVHG